MVFCLDNIGFCESIKGCFQSRLNLDDGEKERDHLKPNENEHRDAQYMLSLAPKQNERQKGRDQQDPSHL